MTTNDRVLAALDHVYDPELDESIVALRFVHSCSVSPDGDVDVRLRLPTPQCAPNFAFLMVADAQRAVRAVPGVRHAHVALEDHYTEREINGAIAGGNGFEGAFPGESTGDLEALRVLFQRKALVARQSRVFERLFAEDEAASAGLRLSELPPEDRDVQRCWELRRALGLENGPDSPAFVRPDGSPLSAQEIPRWRRAGRLINTSLESNGGFCRSLLAVRHGRDEAGAVVA